MARLGLIRLHALCLLSLAVARPTTSEAFLNNVTGIQAGFGPGVLKPPHDLGIEMHYFAETTLDTLQAERAVIAVMAEVAQSDAAALSQSRSWRLPSSPDIEIVLAVRAGQPFQNIHFLWVLCSLLRLMVGERGRNFIEARADAYLKDQFSGRIGLLKRSNGRPFLNDSSITPQTLTNGSNSFWSTVSRRGELNSIGDTSLNESSLIRTSLLSNSSNSLSLSNSDIKILYRWNAHVELNEQMLYVTYAVAIMFLLNMDPWEPFHDLTFHEPGHDIQFELISKPGGTERDHTRSLVIRMVGGLAQYTAKEQKYWEPVAVAAIRTKSIYQLSFIRVN